jgi:tetratricopeptide (TPR) repeat protein
MALVRINGTERASSVLKSNIEDGPSGPNKAVPGDAAKRRARSPALEGQGVLPRALIRSLLIVILIVTSACSSRTMAPANALTPLSDWRLHLDAGKAAHKRGDQQTAEREFRAALDATANEKPPGLRSAVCLNALAVLYLDAGRSNDAAPMLDEAIRIFEERGETDDEFFAMLLTNRAQLAFGQGRLTEAERDSRRALAIAAVPKAVHDRAVTGLVASLCAQGRIDEAKRLGAGLSLGCQDDSKSFEAAPSTN